VIVTLLTLHLLAVSFWVGSLGALAIATRTAKAVLDRRAQAVYFPRLGRTYGTVGSAALLFALLSGAVLAGTPGQWPGAVVGALVTGVALVVVSVVAMGQARRVGVLRRAVAGGDDTLIASLATNVRTTDVLRAAITTLTLVAVVLEAAAIAQR
jgi:hypothetical protein